MKTRNVALTLGKAQKWYNSGNTSLREVALQTFTEEELKATDFRYITTMADVLRALNMDSSEFTHTIKHLEKYSTALAAAYKLNLIRKALNLGQKMDFIKGTIWYPYTPAVLPRNSYCKGSHEIEVAKVRIGCDTFTLLGGTAAYGAIAGLGNFHSHFGVAYSHAFVGFLGCATKEIFEAKYGDTVDFEWV